MAQGIVADTLFRIIGSRYTGPEKMACTTVEGNPEWFNQIPKGGFFVASYLRDFRHLWCCNHGGLTKLAEAVLSSNTSQLPILFIVTWDGIPPGDTYPVNTAQYLTPIDWAVALSLEIQRLRPSKEEYPDFRLHIFDIGSQDVPDAHSINFINFLRPASKSEIIPIPWIRIYRPVTTGSDNWDATRLFADIGLTGDEDSDQDPPAGLSGAMSQYATGLDTLRKVWVANLTRPAEIGDHHAIANLIGPQLLLGDVSDRRDSNVLALRNLLESLGLLPREGHETIAAQSLLAQERPWINWKEQFWSNNLARITEGADRVKVNLILLDDQWRQGWGEVLCKAVGTRYREPVRTNESQRALPIDLGNEDATIRVTSASSPGWLTKLLYDGIDRRFSLRLNEGNLEILFLDLRLYSGRNIQDEVNFFGSVLDIARQIRTRGNLPWRSFERDELERIERWLVKEVKTREDDEYFEALTLLPRVIALTDPSYPIILFSSTGRRRIIELLRDYGNVITGFEKPQFSGSIPEDVATLCRSMFLDAMKAGCAILQGRRAIRNILMTTSGEPDSSKIEGDKYVEVFIDESGDTFSDKFIVGGLILVYPDKPKADLLDSRMKLEGLTWVGRDGREKRSGQTVEERVAEFNILVDKIGEVLDSCAEYKIPFTLERDALTTGKTVNVLNNQHLDNLYLKMCRDILDAVLYELIPWYLGTKNQMHCKIYCATRARQKDKEGTQFTKQERDALKEDFGVDVVGKDLNYYRALKRDSFIPILSDVVFARPNPVAANVVVEGALGVPLRYTPELPDGFFRHAHYLADQITYFTFVSGSQGTLDRDVFLKWFADRGMRDLSDSGFEAALDASKYLEADNCVEALLQAVVAQRRYSARLARNQELPDRVYSVIPKILAKIKKMIGTLGGEDFLRFCSSLSDHLGERQVKRRPSTASVSISQADQTQFKEFGKVFSATVVADHPQGFHVAYKDPKGNESKAYCEFPKLGRPSVGAVVSVRFASKEGKDRNARGFRYVVLKS